MSSGKHPPPAAAAAAVAAAAAPAPPPDAPNFQGRYKFERNEELGEYLNAIGLSWFSRMLVIHVAPPELNITQDGDTFTIKFNCRTQNKKDLTFTVGQEFEVSQHNGNIVKVNPVWEGKKLVMTFEPKEEGKGKSEKQTRELHEDELIHTFESGDLMARRFFKRIV